MNAGVDDIGPNRRHIIVTVSRDARRQPPGALEYFTATALRPVGITFPVLPFGPALLLEVLLDRVFHQTGQHSHQWRTILKAPDELAQRALKVGDVKNDFIGHLTRPPVSVIQPATAGTPVSVLRRRPVTAARNRQRSAREQPAPGGVTRHCG